MTTILSPGSAFATECREVLHIPTANGHAIGATLHVPLTETENRKSKILLLPGWSGPRTGPAELLVQLASTLAAHGHVVLRIDLHGRGDSTGRFETCDLDRMIADAETALGWLQKQVNDCAIQPFPSEGTGTRIVVGGMCSGGNVALGLAALRPKDLAGVVALSALPFQPTRSSDFDRRRRWKSFKHYVVKALEPSTWARLLKGEINVERVKKNLGTHEKTTGGERNLKDSVRDIEKELLAWKGRALFVWGGGDEEASPARAHFEKLHAAGFALTTRLETITGANHNFYARAWREELGTLIASFCSSA